MEMKSRYFCWKAYFALCALFTSIAFAAPVVSPATNNPPKISIVIDNLGDQKQTGLEVARLPGDIGCSILPHTQFSVMLAEECHRLHKTIILNTPMQAIKPFKLGPGGLRQGMPENEFIATLNQNLQAVPYVEGLDNHMGSLLTTETREMNWLLQTIKPQGLFFLDNRTSPHSVVLRLAKENNVPAIGRDIFLDDVRTPEAVHKQFNEALKIAKRYGSVVIVGHPNAVTIKFLTDNLPRLTEQGYQLVPITALLSNTEKKIEQAPVAKVEKVEIATEAPPKIAVTKKLTEQTTPAIKQYTVAATTQPLVIHPSPQKIELTETTVMSAPTAVTHPAAVHTTTEAPKPSLWHRITSSIRNLWPAHKAVTNKEVMHTESKTAEKPVTKSTNNATTQLVEKLQAHGAKNKPELEKSLLARMSTHQNTVSHSTATNNIKPLQQHEMSATAPAKNKTGFITDLRATLCHIYSRSCVNIQKSEKTVVAIAPPPPEPPFESLQGKLPWPTVGSVLIHFGEQVERGGLHYTGVLIQAPLGQPVYAIYPGRVVFANWLQGFGLLLIIDHGDGYMTLYGHNQILYKKVGDMVRTAEQIAAVGNSGRHVPTGLYFEIRHNSEPIDPQQWCAIQIKNGGQTKVG